MAQQQKSLSTSNKSDFLQVRRGKVESHLQTDMGVHLDLACLKLHKLEEKISALEDKPIQCQEVYTWKISGFSEVLKKTHPGTSKIHSAPFYVGENGYKVKLRLYPNGYGSGKNTHVSLFLVIMKGEYDPILPWPFHKKVTFMLIDQHQNLDEREDIVSSMTTDPKELGCNGRPETVENSAQGFHRFALHDEIKEECYIADDTIFIQVKVLPP